MFKAILEKWACKHQWAELSRAEKKSTITDNLVEVQVFLCCKNCGKIKKLVAR